MKFDVIIGNPPYQQSTGGGTNGGIPLYPLFLTAMAKLRPKYMSLIIPTRWYIDNTRKSSQDVRDIILTNKTQMIVDIPNAEDVFHEVHIAGGVMYFLKGDTEVEKCKVYKYGDNHYFEAELSTEKFIRDEIAYKIYNKMMENGERSIEMLAFKMNPYGLLRADVGDLEKVLEDDVEVISSSGIGYMRRRHIEKNEGTIDKYKVIVGYGTAADDKVIIPRILKPNQVCTLTYCVFGCFHNMQDATLYENYLKLKLVRYLIKASRVNSSTTHENLAFVPLLDISKYCSDQQLYERYNLSQNEIEHIESTIRAID